MNLRSELCENTSNALKERAIQKETPHNKIPLRQHLHKTKLLCNKSLLVYRKYVLFYFGADSQSRPVLRPCMLGPVCKNASSMFIKSCSNY